MRTIHIEIQQMANRQTLSITGALVLHPGSLEASHERMTVLQFTSGDLTPHDLQRVMAAVWEQLNTWGYEQRALSLD